jgi:beta-lactamase class A
MYRIAILTSAASLLCYLAIAQVPVPKYYKQEEKFNESLRKIARELSVDGSYNVGEDGMEQISFAVIDLNGKKPVLGGVHMDNFIYPASVYKMYVAMEVLKQVSQGKYSLSDPYVVRSPNDVDRSREISFDPRPLLKNADTVTINYLLDLMITRSDNSAANCLIDIAGRVNINRTMRENNWNGSEVTRKFLKRKLEDPGYDTVRSTETCALHAADFMYRIFTNQLIDPWVSMQMRVLLGRQLDKTKLAQGLPPSAMFYHKTGWWSYYTHDVGIADDGHIRYIIAFFSPLKEEDIRPVFKDISRRVYELVKSRHQAFKKNPSW